MNIWIYNQSFKKVAVIDNFVSLIWTKQYNKAGDFELYLPASPESLAVLKQDNYIMREDDSSVMVIEKIEITTSSEDGNFLLITGRSLESILDRRVVWKQVTYLGSPESIIYTLLLSAFINPDDSNRKINGFAFRNSTGVSHDRVIMQFTGDNLYESITSICNTYGIGFKLDKDFLFTLYAGKDRSTSQTANTKVVFSPLHDNLISSDYYTNKEPKKTIALVGGEGEGKSRTYIDYGTSDKGINRRELFVDAKDLRSKDSDGNSMTPSEYRAVLTERAKEKLAENNTLVEFGGKIEPSVSYEYKEDYDIGDIVTVRNEYNISENCRITAVTECFDSDGYTVEPTYEKE